MLISPLIISVSKSIIERGNYKVNVLEEVSCDSKKDLLKKER